jgi:hypothetical protein
MLAELVTEHGDTDWSTIANAFSQRTARQCKDRWTHYLAPNVTRRHWTRGEDHLLIEKVKQYGQQWKRLEEFFPGRKDNHLKNRHRLLLRRADKTAMFGSDCWASIDDEGDGIIFASDADEWVDLHSA